MPVDLGRAPTRHALDGATLTDQQLREVAVTFPRPESLAREIEASRPVKRSASRLGIVTVADLIEHVPVAHDVRAVVPVRSLRNDEDATIEVKLGEIAVRPTRRPGFKLVEARVSDRSGSAKAVWFNQAFLARTLKPGMRLRLFGKRRGGAFQVREHTVLADGTPAGAIATTAATLKRGANAAQTSPGTSAAVRAEDNGEVIGVYPGTEGLTSARLRELVNAVRGAERNVVDPLPGRLRAALRLPDRGCALSAMHYPAAAGESDVGRRRLAFEELLLQQLALDVRRRRRDASAAARPLSLNGLLVDRWMERLPFALTDGQRRAIAEVGADLAADRPMQRLLMGEVGSGKTVCALAAMLRAAEDGCQAALMAPTETLAEQHFATLDAMLPEVPLALVTGSTTAARRAETLRRLAGGELPLIVGTHALIEPDVEFRSLVLAVVDEQHRFGVRQRAALDAKAPAGLAPHILHMTATPIPRTLALVGYGDLDVSEIRELPRDRAPVETRVIAGERRAGAYERVRELLRAGRQAYVVCPLVEESELLQATAATAEAERLAAGEFRDFKVDLIHGQMGAKKKAAAMAAFVAGETDVLIATSVIEVGIDVPNAAAMIVEDAERYGISQLHQLRGRIGRGPHASVCFLFGPPGSARLRALARSRDGFELAGVDLKLRGAGEWLGTRQHGMPRFRFAVLPDDEPLLELARSTARSLIDRDPELAAPENTLLRAAMVERHGEDLDSIPA